MLGEAFRVIDTWRLLETRTRVELALEEFGSISFGDMVWEAWPTQDNGYWATS